ncbi:aspartate kinase [Mesonia mobilis]|uniref:Aspartokinase n=1 Tax=Mesonia mobilis TaxID=369791 RepID=A0ABQ3BHS9_9FLAO|nr:aspartate kinase [Mesonia mobilis]MBQ0737672.1 aspartate kinase [Aquimarina celericrescens]GGZ44494.1 aspartokinase [Mesonia mobilis]
MKVLKFGGTSVGSIANIQKVKEIIHDGEPKIVVLSAMSGSTNKLVELSQLIKSNQIEDSQAIINQLEQKYLAAVSGLIESEERKETLKKYIFALSEQLQSFVDNQTSNYNEIVAQGELFSTYLVNQFLQEQGVASELIPALDFMRVDKEGEPDYFYIQQSLNRILKDTPNQEIYVTQGFICLNNEGNISNLKRGGSDYTASIIGAAIRAEEVQIWTDIDGFHNNDPRVVDNTRSIAQLSFDEAAELAYFGAKILHPQTVLPVRNLEIPVRLKNTNLPEAEGTLISNRITGEGIKAIAAKDGITAIKIKSERMLLAHGFLKKIFEIFEKYETAIDMITTSEIAVSLTIDDNTYLTEITSELLKFAQVEVEENRSIVCLVGNNIIYHKTTPQIFQILQNVNVRMVAYGGSNNNISLLVNAEDKEHTLRSLNHYAFNPNPTLV